MHRRNVILAGLSTALALGGASSRTWAGATGSAFASFQQGFAPYRFGQVHYWQGGASIKPGAVPLLCLHASPGSSRSYSSFLPLIAAQRAVLAADTPGYGLSDPPPSQPRIEDYADSMIAMAESLKLKKIDLLGNHTSSSTALEIAIRRPDLVRKIVLNSALVYTPEEVAKLRESEAAYVGVTQDSAASKVPQDWPRMRAMLRDMSEDDAWAFFWEVNRNPTRSLWGYEASFTYDARAALPRVTQPMLVVSPNDVLRAPSLRARELMRQGEVMELPWSAGTFTTHAAEMARLIGRFLDTD
jgi:pimeloyl-ACP methyl ester carboxylesterase